MSIKEATPQNRPNYFRQGMAVRGAVGDLAGNSQDHLLGFSDKLQRLAIETTNKTAATIAGVPCSADTFSVSQNFYSASTFLVKFRPNDKAANSYAQFDQ